MNVDYIAFGNVMLDTIVNEDGSTSREAIGGPASFAYSGIKLWTDAVMQSSRVGEDYHALFDPWIAENHILMEGFEEVVEHCNHSYLRYRPDGTYYAVETKEHFRSDWIQDFGYMKTSPEQIAKWTGKYKVKGIYLAQSCDCVWWRKLKEIKERDGFRMMWEIEAPSAYQKHLQDVLRALECVDVFSINIQECENLFGIKGEEACVKALRNLPVDLTLFRVGSRGLYCVSKEAVHYLPPAPSAKIVDPTGCGNTSSGAALFAYCEGYDPARMAAMSNVVAGFNAMQYGVFPFFSDEIMADAESYAEELVKKAKRM